MPKRAKMTPPIWTEGKDAKPSIVGADATKKVEKGKLKGQTIYLDLEKWKALGYLAIDLDRSQRDLLLEAVDLLLHKYKRQ